MTLDINACGICGEMREPDGARLAPDAPQCSRHIESKRVRRCELSDCGTYRYSLEEGPSNMHPLVWIMVNPSTADAIDDDATIRKVRGFTERFGFGRWVVVNLFAFRTRDITACKSAHRQGRAIGPNNDQHILKACRDASDIICAWGPKPWAYPRAHGLIQRLRTELVVPPTFHALGFSQGGAPLHPLFRPYSTTLVPYTEAP